jgi:hypothetical protein
MKTKILISIFAIVAAAGCTIPGISGIPGMTPGTNLGGGQGLEITSFTAQPETLFSGSTDRIIMEIGNQGGTTVPSGSAIAYLTGSNIEFASSASTPLVWLGPSGGAYLTVKEVKAEDVVRGLSAGSDRVSWTLTSPTLTAGQVRTDTFIGRLYSEYQSNAYGSVWVYGETEVDAAKAAGRPLEKSSFTYTKGPVGVEVISQPDPVIIYGNDKTFSLYIKVTNLATGTIYKYKNITYDPTNTNKVLVSDALNKVFVNITKPPNAILNITNSDECLGFQELVAGRPTTVVCDFNITEAFTTYKSYPLSVEIKYGYYTERQATVTIQGR